MRSLTIVVSLALFERGLVTAKYYNFIASQSKAIELATLIIEPSISVGTHRDASFGSDAAEFWVGDGDQRIIAVPGPGKSGSLQHAGFNYGAISRPFRPIYFAEKTDKSELTITRKVRGHTLHHAMGFAVENSRNTKLTFDGEDSRFAFCPCPFGDVDVIGGEPYKNQAGYPMVLSVMEEGSARAAGCILTVIRANKLETAAGKSPPSFDWSESENQ